MSERVFEVKAEYLQCDVVPLGRRFCPRPDEKKGKCGVGDLGNLGGCPYAITYIEADLTQQRMAHGSVRISVSTDGLATKGEKIVEGKVIATVTIDSGKVYST